MTYENEAPRWPIDPKTTRVVFAVDNGTTMRGYARFMRHLDTLRAMGKLAGPVRLAVGAWTDPDTGRLDVEPSFDMLLTDFAQWVRRNGWVSQQKAVLLVSGAGEASFCHPEHIESDAMHMGRYVALPMADAVTRGGWTLYHDTGEVCTVTGSGE